MDLKDIQRHIDQEMNKQNNRSIPEFEGYSPLEMHKILHFTFAKDSPLEMQKLSNTDYKTIPILNQIKYLTDLIDKNGEIKLTNKGFLPTKIVSELYNQGFLKDEHIDKGISKLYKETDSMTVNLTRILIELAGLTKKRNGKISLTKSSQKILRDNEELLRQIFLTFTNKFNWAYYDGYGENQIGQLGYGFSLILLSKYGQTKLLDSYYAEKYFRAYPKLLDSLEPTYGTLEKYASRCYSIRIFDRFLDYFGLIRIEEEKKGLDSIKYITKTELFDRLIKVRPHNRVDGR
ncbi:hypothetical protein L21SP5_03657 [Salinivirga cyanobacteriivorans]|uniref:Uncharacterized protein n=1 Tax=Salinivirga cyanobacteriivorans TaxID=1307839 RepID=A0A0S2I475_9BACT|nr:hypothetical protein [Salinivirga cyanobacteriivorans]ALO17257.1 hypothetical protein L21SP5_03657 [Salinivirga cyanobacteriivorans]